MRAVIIAAYLACVALPAAATEPTCQPQTWIGHPSTEKLGGKTYRFEDLKDVRRALLRAMPRPEFERLFGMRSDGPVMLMNDTLTYKRCASTGCNDGTAEISFSQTTGKALVHVVRKQRGGKPLDFTFPSKQMHPPIS